MANSANLNPIGELTQARGRSLNVGLNKPGDCQFTVPLSDALSASINPVTTCVLAYRDNVMRWSGPVWNMTEQLPQNRISVQAVGWFELLNHRIVDATQVTFPLVYSGTDGATIATNFLAYANAQTYATPISIGTVQASQTRTITYDKNFNVGGEIERLSQIEGGFDYEVAPSTRRLNIYTSKGSTTSVVFGYRFGPHNVQSFTRTRDAGAMVNRQYALGASNSVYADGDTQNTYGIFSSIQSLAPIDSTTLLTAFAIAEVEYRKTPRVTYQLTPFPYNDAGNVPKFFDDYYLGDVVYLTAKYGTVDIENQAIRVFGAGITIDDSGNEKITSLQTANS